MFINGKPTINNDQLPKVGEETQILIIHFIKKTQDEMTLSSINFKTYRWHSFEKVPLQKGNIKYFEIYGYNSEALESRDVFLAPDSDMSFFEAGARFDTKQLLGRTAN